jgi:Signal transduction histidine kinase
MTAGHIADVMLTHGIDRNEIHVKSVIEKEIESIRSSNRGVTIEIEGELADQAVLADQMLEAVFRNLLKNAIHHNDTEAPEIVISTTASDDMLAVRIADNGPGVSDERKESIFGKGEQGLESEGTGMGLHLVDTLITEYGGDVWVEDSELGGAVFVVALPVPD